MTEKEIIKYIDAGANFYVSMFGRAEHMEVVDNGFYTYIKPKAGEYGITFIYDIRIGELPAERQKILIDEIKSLNMPVWLDLLAEDELYRLVYGKAKVHGQTALSDEDEVYLAMLPEEKLLYHTGSAKIVQVQSAGEFAVWAKIANDILAGGKPDMHPVYHYPLCEKGLMQCYVLYDGNTPVSVASIMNNDGIASLELVAAIPEMRRRGFAKAVCEKAICDTFARGAKIITVRAVNAAAGRLYQSMGFKAYNYAI